MTLLLGLAAFSILGSFGFVWLRFKADVFKQLHPALQIAEIVFWMPIWSWRLLKYSWEKLVKPSEPHSREHRNDRPQYCTGD